MNEKKIITFFLILLLTSAAYLSYFEKRQQDPLDNKDWWTVSFADPKGPGAVFVIKNFSGETRFHWEVRDDGRKTEEAAFEVPRGASKGFVVKTKDFSGRISIVVTAGKEKKEIYKIIR